MRRLLVLSLLVFTALGSQAQKRSITERDLFDFNWIADPQYSLDLQHPAVVWVQAKVAADRSGYETSLYFLDLSAPNLTPVQLTQGPHDSAPRWNGNGSQLAFLRSVDVAGKSTPAQLYVINMQPTVTAPERITDPATFAKGVANPQWCPNGAALAVLAQTTLQSPAAKRLAARKARMAGDEAHVSDVLIINKSNYRSNGEGYVDTKNVPQIWEIGVPTIANPGLSALQLTNRHIGVQEFAWANPSWLIYTSLPWIANPATDNTSEEPYYQPYPHNSIYAFDPPALVAGQQQQQAPLPPDIDPFPVTLIVDLPFEAHGLSVAPLPAGPVPANGLLYPARLAFHAEAFAPPANLISHRQSDLFALDLNWTTGNPVPAGSPRNLTGALSYEMGSGVGGDNTAPRGGGRGGIAWSSEASHLFDIAGFRGSALLVSVDAIRADQVTELTARHEAVLAFTMSPDRKTTLALISDPLTIGELDSIGPSQSQTPITHVNDALFAKLELHMPLDIQMTPTVARRDLHGETIDTFIMLPAAAYAHGSTTPAPPATPLPTILNIHGGPHAAYGWVFDQEMLTLAARGYVVIYPNPRGSTTYGQNFANIIENNYPGDDFHDLMDTVDATIKLGYADPARLGVTGGSGGGLLTDWVVTQTNRFKAAVAQRDITDWANWWYTADVAGFHQSFYPKSPPFENEALYKAHSPLTFVNNIKTPMMFILGDADYRTPPGAGGEVFFRALKYKHIDTVMVRFPRESHELSRSGEPWHRIERLENITNWFDKYLLKKCEPQYDVSTASTSCTP